jgi:chromate transporter
MNRDLVERREWLRSGDMTEALAYTKPLPGSTVVEVVTFLGWRLGGWPKAIVATVIFLLPAFVIMTVAAAAVSSRCPTRRWSETRDTETRRRNVRRR